MDATTVDAAVDVAGRYLKLAAISWARRALADGFIHNDDDQIARIEVMLRAARHMRRIAGMAGDPIPSMRRTDGSKVPVVLRLIEIMGRERVILADQHDDPGSRSNSNRAIREARDEIIRVASEVLREGELEA
jgi:hypothetical protein